jgi:hypothetical protein
MMSLMMMMGQKQGKLFNMKVKLSFIEKLEKVECVRESREGERNGAEMMKGSNS